MGLFRRRSETLNEQLLREAGLDSEQALGDPLPEPDPPAEPLGPPLRSGSPSPIDPLRAYPTRELGTDEWDAVVTVKAVSLAGDRIEFTTLPNGDIIVEKERGDGDVSPLADAVEEKIDRPYKAFASRHAKEVWAVGAKRIEVAQIPFPRGDELELSQNGAYSELRIDGELSDAAVPPELERLGEQVGRDYCVEASRIDGDFWEVRVSAL